MERIPLAQPTLGGNESRYVQECLETTWISSNGRFIGSFEAAFAEACQLPHAVSCCNGTVALHVALLGLGVRPGDEVILPSLTYVATANAVRYCGAVPVFVDSELDTWNLSPDDVERKITPRTRAIIAVDLYGRVAPMVELEAIARSRGLALVEDAAEAHGAELRGRPAGSFGDVATFSFYGNKIITCGEGGMVVTGDAHLADAMRLIKGQGQDPHRRYWHPIVGFNYRMTNIEAALGLAQLEQLPTFLAARDRIRHLYEEALDSVAGVCLPSRDADGKTVCWLYTVLLDGDRERRDQVIHEMDRQGIETRPVFYPVHQLPPYRELPGLTANSNADSLSSRGLTLPTWVGMNEDHVQRIVGALVDSLALVGSV
jgi:perosamine synthetase